MTPPMPTNKPEVVLPEQDLGKTQNEQGLFRKYEVRRTDGSDFPGGKHDGCEYFVLDMTHDPHAKAAAAAYADSAEMDYPDLAAEMRGRYGLDTLTRPADGERMPTVPQAFFDEFGVNADDRVMDYGQACYDAGVLSAAPQQHGQEVDEAERGLQTPRRVKAVELLLSLGYQWDGTQWHQPQQPAEAVAEYQYRKPGAHDDSWHRMTQEEYEASLATGHCCGIASWTKNFELRKLYTAPPPTIDIHQTAETVVVDAATPRPMETAPRDGTMVRLLVQFDEYATEDTEGPVWTIGANNFDNEGDEGQDRWQFAGWCWSHDHFTEGKGTPIGWLPLIGGDTPPLAIDIGKLRELVARRRRYDCVLNPDAKSFRKCADELAALIGDGGDSAP